MKNEIVNGIRVITPSEGMWLYKSADRIISDKVFLGVNDNESGWGEITEERKTELKTLWEVENDFENSVNYSEINQKAQAYDIIIGGAE